VQHLRIDNLGQPGDDRLREQEALGQLLQRRALDGRSPFARRQRSAHQRLAEHELPDRLAAGHPFAVGRHEAVGDVDRVVQELALLPPVSGGYRRPDRP